LCSTFHCITHCVERLNSAHFSILRKSIFFILF
ncbi:unnamed protein product, partial [Rotaria sp. Silwood2]